MKALRRALLLLPAMIVITACGGPSPEEQIRETIADATAAAMARDVSTLRDLISGAYHDGEGRDKQTVTGLVGLYLRQNQSIYLLAIIDEVEATTESAGRAVVLVATAGRPIESTGDLRDMQADLNRVEIELALEDGDLWRVTSAHWEPASAADFF